MHGRSSFYKPSGNENLNESQKLLQSAQKYFYVTFSSFWAKLCQKKSFLVRSEILRLLVNTLTANYQYSRSNRENLPPLIQMQLTEKPKTFVNFLLHFCNLY